MLLSEITMIINDLLQLLCSVWKAIHHDFENKTCWKTYLNLRIKSPLWLWKRQPDYNFLGLQKQMLFMRCAFESRQEQLTIYPFPGLKVINIRGSNLLALDLITIGSFVSRLSDNNRLLELSMRDYPLDETGLRGLLPCLPLVRTVTLCARRLHDPSSYKMIGM